MSAHAFRHSFVQAVSEYLGHADTSTTLRYYTHEALNDSELTGERV